MGKLLWESLLPFLDPWDGGRLRTASTHCNVPGKYGPHGALFFFLTEKEQVVASNEVLPNPCVSARKRLRCALIGLHLLAADYEIRRHVAIWVSKKPDLEQPSALSRGLGARASVSCRMAMNLLCQEVRDACWVSPE